MEYTFDVYVTQRDANVALRRFIGRGAGWRSLIGAVLLVCYVGHDTWDGEIGYLSVAFLMLLLSLIGVYVAGFLIRRRQVTELLHRLGDTPVTYRLDETELGAESMLGNTTLK